MNRFSLLAGLSAMLLLVGCDYKPSADQVEANKQEHQREIQAQQVGFPALPNSKEKRALKDLYELRDRSGVVTYTYVYSEMFACFRFVNVSDGFGIPYATQYSAPEKLEFFSSGGWKLVPQSEPNGLYPPASADGTWLKSIDPADKTAKAGYFEPKLVVVQTKLAPEVLCPPVADMVSAFKKAQ